MAKKWTTDSVVQKRINIEADNLVEELQKSVQSGSKIDKSARLIAEARFLQKKIESERTWRDYYERESNRLKDILEEKEGRRRIE